MKSKVTYDGYEKVKKHDYNNGNGPDDTEYNKSWGSLSDLSS